MTDLKAKGGVKKQTGRRAPMSDFLNICIARPNQILEGSAETKLGTCLRGVNLLCILT